jgi:uncharacterized membrane protein
MNKVKSVAKDIKKFYPGGKFKMLKSLALLLRTLGWLGFAIGVVMAITLLVSPQTLVPYGIVTTLNNSTFLAALGSLIGAVIWTMVNVASAEAIDAFLSIEESTSKLREVLDRK